MYYNDICFKQKKDVFVLGFEFLHYYEKKTFKLKFKYNIDDVEYPKTNNKRGWVIIGSIMWIFVI